VLRRVEKSYSKAFGQRQKLLGKKNLDLGL
jgi:hypothetical protein